MTTSEAELFLKEKAKEKGIDPVYPDGYPVPEEQDPNFISKFFLRIAVKLGIKNNGEERSLIDDIENIVSHKLSVLDTGQTSMKFRINEILKRIGSLESKIDKLIRKK